MAEVSICHVRSNTISARAFVIMPFDKAFDDLYGGAIRPVLQAEGYDALRLDETPAREPVLVGIRAAIETADLVVAVLTGKNPNVFFELGFTLASRKASILLAHSGDDIPCFLQHLPQVLYWGDVETARAGLASALSAAEIEPASRASCGWTAMD